MVGVIAAKPTTQDNEDLIRLRFGGGLNTRASIDEIDPRECTSGENFDLDRGNSAFRPRSQFDLAGTAPNGAEIRGFAQLVDSDSVITTLIQAGANVYQTDFTTWTSVGTVNSSAQIRGPNWHIWNLDDLVLISDVAGVNPVTQWDGTTFSEMSHNLTGDFIAKYIFIDNERALYGNVISNSPAVATPHMVVGSQEENFNVLSITDQPSSALSTADPFYILTPDLRPINGMTGAFGIVAISTKRGQTHQLIGNDAQDFELTSLFPGSYADGDESMAYVGNDIVFGRPGRIESLISTDTYGDVETDDLTFKIFDQIQTYTGWRIVYSSRHQRIYCHPSGKNELWIFHKPLSDSGLSPWMKWTTKHSMNFNPSTIWSMLDPESGLEHVYCGDAFGGVYRLEGTGTGGDGGSQNVIASRTSPLSSAPANAQYYDLQGAVKYVASEEVGFEITALWQGESVFNTKITATLPTAPAGAVYGGSYYYSGTGSYFGGSFSGRISREKFTIAGQGNDLQLKTQVSSTNPFEVTEVLVGIRGAG